MIRLLAPRHKDELQSDTVRLLQHGHAAECAALMSAFVKRVDGGEHGNGVITP